MAAARDTAGVDKSRPPRWQTRPATVAVITGARAVFITHVEGSVFRWLLEKHSMRRRACWNEQDVIGDRRGEDVLFFVSLAEVSSRPSVMPGSARRVLQVTFRH